MSSLHVDRRTDAGTKVRTLSWIRAGADGQLFRLRLGLPESDGGRVNMRSFPGWQSVWICFSVAKCTVACRQ